MPDRSRHFSRRELQCKHTGYCDMDQGFLDKLDALREAFGAPLVLTSAFRTAGQWPIVRRNAVGLQPPQAGAALLRWPAVFLPLRLCPCPPSCLRLPILPTVW